MSKVKDITCQKFGKLTALYRLHNYYDKKHTRWLCICDCGNLVETQMDHLISGHTKSCGCLNSETSKKVHTKHGKRNTSLYNVYYGMKSRCYNNNNPRYIDYGGRGITICDEWLTDFVVFCNWAISNGYQEGLQLDRIDNDGNYEPSNCRWVDIKTQGRNKRNNKYITYQGETKLLIEWCEILNLNYDTVQSRLRRGWQPEKCLK